MAFHQSRLICVKRSAGKGRGVFANDAIPSGSMIERSPVIEIPENEVSDVLQRYCYSSDGKFVFGCGFLSLYNHSRKPNAASYDSGKSAMEVIALRDIGPGEEITIDYGKSFYEEAWY